MTRLPFDPLLNQNLDMSPRSAHSAFDEAEQHALIECGNLTQELHKLAELQPSIQIAQALHLNEGPYSNLRQNIIQTGSRYASQGPGNDVGEASESSEDGEVGAAECSRCGQRVPYHALAFHENSCTGYTALSATNDSKEASVELPSDDL